MVWYSRCAERWCSWSDIPSRMPGGWHTCRWGRCSSKTCRPGNPCSCSPKYTHHCVTQRALLWFPRNWSEMGCKFIIRQWVWMNVDQRQFSKNNFTNYYFLYCSILHFVLTLTIHWTMVHSNMVKLESSAHYTDVIVSIWRLWQILEEPLGHMPKNVYYSYVSKAKTLIMKSDREGR